MTVGARWLLADIGGTHSRLALAGPGGIDWSTLAVCRNDEVAGAAALLDRYVAGCGGPAVCAAALALAGPVGGGAARLTNRGWWLDPEALSRALGGARVTLLNDLVALGHALPDLPATALDTLRPAAGRRPNGQSLVLGVGTGCNACLARRGAGVMEAELGMAAPPAWLTARLAAAGAPPCVTLEECFSARGLAALERAAPGRAEALMAALLGRWLRELVCLYLPRDGIYLAGGIARRLLQSPARDDFLFELSAARGLPPGGEGISVHLIVEDAAALLGGLRVLRAADQ